MKPHIKFNSVYKLWQCTDEFNKIRFGKTPTAALYTSRNIVIIPRRGVWNKQSCKAWYNNGCPTINSWINQRRILAYMPETDELVLSD